MLANVNSKCRRLNCGLRALIGHFPVMRLSAQQIKLADTRYCCLTYTNTNPHNYLHAAKNFIDLEKRKNKKWKTNPLAVGSQ